MSEVVTSAPPSVHRLNRHEYERMVERGALEGMPVELVDGFLVDVSPQGPQHAAMVQALMRWFAPHVDLLRVQMPLAAGESSEPEPDIALVEHDDPTRHPHTALLVIEVAVSSHGTGRAQGATSTPGPPCRPTGSSTCAHGPSPHSPSRQPRGTLGGSRWPATHRCSRRCRRSR